MGQVYRVRDHFTGQVVALKVVRETSPEDVQLFRREIVTLSSLWHESIVRFFDAGVCGDDFYFTMELVEGSSLEQFISPAAAAAADVKWILAVVVQLLDALSHLHERGLLHRDIKPSNVVALTAPPQSALQSTSAAQIKLIDFGLAAQRRSIASGPDASVGTPVYMAPEQLRGHTTIDERADLFSVGAMAYHLLTGSPPRTSLRDAVAGEPPIDRYPQDCPRRAVDLIRELLANERHERPASAAAARERLLAALEPEDRRRIEAPRIRLPSFVGRQGEVAALTNVVRSAADGRSGFVRLTGDRGSGKSWVLHHSGLKAVAFGDLGTLTVGCRFRADDSGAGLRELYSQLLAHFDEHSASDALRDHHGAEAVDDFVSTFGVQTRPDATTTATSLADDIPPHVRRERLLTLAIEIVRAASGRQPLLLVVDDVHHAGEFALEFFSRLRHSIGTMRVAVVLSHRPQPESSAVQIDSTPFASFLEQLDDVDVVTLPPLTDGEVSQLIDSMLFPSVISKTCRDALTQRSGGWPGAVVSDIQLVWSRRRLRFQDGAWCWDRKESAGADASLEKVELDGLTDLERDVLLGVKVLGPPVTRLHLATFVTILRELSTSSGRDIATAEVNDDGRLDTTAARLSAERIEAVGGRVAAQPAVQRLISQGLLVEAEDGIDMSPTLRDTKLESTRQPRLLEVAGAQALIALHASDLEANALRIAQLLHAGGEIAIAHGYFVLSARSASRLYANSRARHSYQAAIETAPDVGRQRAVYIEFGEFLLRLGEYDEALRAFQDSSGVDIETFDAGRTLAADVDPGMLERIGKVLHLQGHYETALRVFETYLELAGSDSIHLAKAQLRLGEIHFESGDSQRASECFEHSLKLYESLGDAPNIAKVQSQLGLVAKQRGDIRAAIERFESALENAERAGHAVATATALNNLGNIHRAQGDDELALDFLRRSVESRRRAGDRGGVAISLTSIAQVHFYRGEFKNAVERNESALRVFREVGNQKGVLVAGCNLAESQRMVGDFKLAREQTEQNLQLADDLKMTSIRPAALTSLANLEVDIGNYGAAVEILERCLSELPPGKLPQHRLEALTALSWAHLRLRDYSRARQLFDDCESALQSSNANEKRGELTAVRVRLENEAGDAERAVKVGRQFLEHTEFGVERFGSACLRRELGRAFRSVGPEWADQTEKHLFAARKEFQDMSSPHNVAEIDFEIGVYWGLFGENEEAGEFFSRSKQTFLRLNAPLRSALIGKSRSRA